MQARSRTPRILALIALGALGLWLALLRDTSTPEAASTPGATGQALAPTGAGAPERFEQPSDDAVLLPPALGAQPRSADGAEDGSVRRPSGAAQDDAFVVQVRTADDRALAPGVDLQLVRMASGQEQTLLALTRHATPVRSARTDERGRASFPELVALVEGRHAEAQSLPALPAGNAWRWVVYADIPCAESVAAQLTPTILAARELELRLPAAGRIRVRIMGADGEALTDSIPANEFEVQLSLVDPDEATRPLLAFERPHWKRTTHGESTVFPWVELGHVYEASAKRKGTDVFSRSERGGPVVEGEEVLLSVQIGKDHPVFAFRAVDEHTSPLREITLEITRHSVFGGGESFVTRTDSDGRFFFEVDRIGIFGGSLQVTANAASGEMLSGSVGYRGGGGDGLQDRGDVVLRTPGALVAGVVVDQQGHAVENAQVFAGLEASTDDLWMRRGPEPTKVRTQRDGRFELHGERLSDKLQVWATRGGRRAGPLEVELGTKDLRLELRPLCAVSGRLVVDEGVPLNVQVALEQDGRHVSGTHTLDSTGSFSMTPVETGTYALRCRAGQILLYEAAELVLEGDLDVGAIDLRGVFTRHELVLSGVAEDGVEGKLRWKPADSIEAEDEGGLWTELDFSTTSIVFWTPSPSVDVELVARGYRKAVLSAVEGRREVELVAPLHVRLVLETDGPIPSPPYIFDPELHADGLQVGNPIGSRFFTDAKREVEFRVATPGRIRVTWHLERRADNMAVGGGVLSGHDVEIDVLDALGVQVFHLPLDGEALRKLVESPPF